MLTAEEIISAVEGVLHKMKETYPTPWPALDLAREIDERRKGVPTCSFTSTLLMALIPAGWGEWFLHLWMAKTLEIYGEQLCREYVVHDHELLEHDSKSTLTGWRCPITVQKLALCEKFWFQRQNVAGGER